MIIEKISSGKIDVTNTDNELVTLKKGDTVVVPDNAGQGYLNNYPQHFKKVETQGEIDEKVTKKQSELEQQVAQLTEKLEEKESQEGQVVALTKQLAELQEKYDSETTTLSNQVKELETQVSMLKDDKEALQSTLNSGEWTVGELEKKIEELEKEKAVLQENFATLEQDLKEALKPAEKTADAEKAPEEVK